MNSTIHYLNGNFVTDKDLVISPRDLGFARGYAVFDFMRTYNGHKPFMLSSHIDRLFRSADKIGLQLPWSKQDIKSIVMETLAKNDQNTEYAIRITISGGVSATLTQAEQPTLIVVLDKVFKHPQKHYDEGISVITVSSKRYRPDAKTTHYVDAIQHIGEMQSANASEILYISEGFILEGAFSNFFCVINGKLVTAKNNVLPGITRLVVTEKLQLQTPIEIRDLKLEELDSATEAFISVSGRHIVPVVRVNEKNIGDGKVGIVTKEVMQKFEEFISDGNW